MHQVGGPDTARDVIAAGVPPQEAATLAKAGPLDLDALAVLAALHTTAPRR